MQIGIRLHDVAGKDFREKVNNAKSQGFSCIHLALQKIEGLAFDRGALTPGYASYIRRILREEEMELAVLGCYLNLAHPDPEEIKKIKDTYQAYIRFASYLGAGVVGTETGAPNSTYSYDRAACHSPRALEILVANLSEITACAEKMGVVIAIEPVYRHIVWNPRVAREVLTGFPLRTFKLFLIPSIFLTGIICRNEGAFWRMPSAFWAKRWPSFI